MSNANTPGPDLREVALSEQLRQVHDMLRRDLASVRDLAARVAHDASAHEVQTRLEELRTRGPLFQLQVNCLTWCQTVHRHHGAEDADLFPAVRRTAPHLARTVDRLEADHRQVQVLLGEVESLADGLDDGAARAGLVDTLGRLATHLLEHLELEEAVLTPVLDSWGSWPPQA